MAVVTDSPRLAPAVLKAGGLPFVATAGLKRNEIRKPLQDARAMLGEQPFGLGMVDFLPHDDNEDTVVGDSTARPDFVTLAGGNASQAAQLEQAGIRVYLHAPSQSLIREFLDSRAQGIILEGHEAGGHVGVLGSLVLWELAVNEILARPGGQVAGLRVLFAGGIMNARSSLAAAVFATPLATRGIGVGLQVGTAYLMTEDAVEAGVVSRDYQRQLLEGTRTILAGSSVNLPNRWLDSPIVRRMICQEFDSGIRKLDFREQKRKVEGLGTARFLDSLGRGDGADGACVCGQGVAIQNECWTIAQLHQQLTEAAQVLARDCPTFEVAEEFPADAVAIVGMGCTFPGAPDVPTFWDNIVNCRDFIREVPERYWDWKLFYSEDRSNTERTYSKIGSFIEGFKKDPLKFRISPRSEPHIDPIQFYVLESVYQAVVDAGYLRDSDPPSESTLPKAETAVFIGHSAGSTFAGDHGLRVNWVRFVKALQETPEFLKLPEETRERLLETAEDNFKKDLPTLSEDTCAGIFNSLVAGRVAHCFDLNGCAVTADAACASALAAVDFAVQALRGRKCSVAIAGAADHRVDPATFVLFCSLGALSPNGTYPFDERADGFVLGEGAGMLVLKRVEDAIRDGNRIYAVIRAIGASSDGRAKGLTAPDVEGQIRAFEKTYQQVPFSPATVSLIEGHGTGTWVGDRAEIASINRFFGEWGAKPRSIALGSVKSMIGHLKTGAGIAGLIKMAMAVHTKVLPATMHCEHPRKDVDWNQSVCYPITLPDLWKAGAHPRRCGVNSFGFGGINFHAVLEEAPVTPALSVTEPARRETLCAEVFLFRAVSRAALISRLNALSAELAGSGACDLHKRALKTLAENSPAGPTLSLVVRDLPEFKSHLKSAVELLGDASRGEISAAQGIYFKQNPLAREAKVAFLFPGQGAQFPGMLDGLLQSFPFTEPTVRRIDAALQRHARTSIIDLLCSKSRDDSERARGAELLERPDYNHPAMLAVSTALVEILGRAGIHPDMVAGHSLGEYAALTVAGVYEIDSSIRLVTQRGSGIASSCLNNGGMVSVALPAQEVQPYLARVAGFVAIANKNCPSQTVVAGDEPAMSQLAEILSAEEIRCLRLKVVCGFHSALVAAAVPSFRLTLLSYPVHQPRVPVQCNVTGAAYVPGDNFKQDLREALVRHMVEPVDFIGNVESMYADGARVFIEVGPGSTLCSFVDNILGERDHWSLAANISRREPVLQIMHVVARCAALGLPVDLKRFQPLFHEHLPLRHVSKTARLPVPAAPRSLPAPVPAASRLQVLEAAFVGKGDAEVSDYLKNRGEFLRQMVELDFTHFQGTLAAPPRTSSADEIRITQLVVEIVARSTGYPLELIGLDLDVESELGLDSIKQVEIVRELRRELNLDMDSDTRGAGYHIDTLRELVARVAAAHCKKNTVQSLSAAPAVSSPATGQGEKTAEQEREQCHLRTDCYRTCSTLSALPPASGGTFLQGKRVAILGAGTPFEKLVMAKLRAAGALPEESFAEADCVVDLLSAETSPLPSLADCVDWWSLTGSAAGRILDAAQACVGRLRQDSKKKVRWTVVSRLGGELGASGDPNPGVATGTGLAMTRILELENPAQVEGLILDFDSGLPEGDTAELIARELNIEQNRGEIGYRGGARFRITLERSDLQRTVSPSLELDGGSVVLAIGGARGITALIAQELARRHGSRFVVVGKTREPDASFAARSTDFAEAQNALFNQALHGQEQISPAELDRQAWETVWAAERAQNMARLRQVATHVEYRQCDLTDPQQASELMRHISKTLGRLDVVLQGSGALPLKSIPDFSQSFFVEGMAPKALGTMSLIAALGGLEVKAFVNLSSVGARRGTEGHASYAAGHEIAAAAVATAARTRAGRWWNIYFGPWLQIGMTARNSTMERFGARSIAFIRGDDGARFVADEIENGAGGCVGYYGGKSTELEAEPPATCSPFLDSLESSQAGMIVAQRTFDPLSDAFVREHLIHVNTCVLAGAIMLEMMAQTGFALLSQSRANAAGTGPMDLTEVEDLQVLRAVRFPSNRPRTIYCRARLAGDAAPGAVTVDIFSLFQPPGRVVQDETIHARCTLRFGKRRAACAPELLFASSGLGRAIRDIGPIWDTEPFSIRRGMFQNLGELHSIVPGNAVIRCLGHPIPELGRAPLTVDPVALDAATLAGSVLSAAYADEQRPYYFSKVRLLRFFAGRPEAEDLFLCRYKLKKRSAEACLADIEIFDHDGLVRIRLESFESIPSGDVAPVPTYSRQIWQALREHHRQARIRELLGLAPGSLQFAQVDLKLVDRALAAHAESVQEEFLCPEERLEWQQLAHEKRRREWLGGRIAAKTAVQILLGEDRPKSQLRIRNRAEDRCPEIEFQVPREGQMPVISISHSRDVAVALASKTAGFGVDVESVSGKLAELLPQFATSKEAEAFQVAFSPSPEALTLLWAAKEACRKALGAAQISACELALREIRRSDDYGIAVFAQPAGEIQCIVFSEDDYAWAAAHAEGVA